MLPKYVGSFTAKVRTVYFCHRFEVSSPFRGIVKRNSEAINSALDYLRRSQICKYPAYCSLRNEMGRNEMEMEICSLRNGNL